MRIREGLFFNARAFLGTLGNSGDLGRTTLATCQIVDVKNKLNKVRGHLFISFKQNIRSERFHLSCNEYHLSGTICICE